jgi:hypothetical protein
MTGVYAPRLLCNISNFEVALACTAVAEFS